MFLKLSLILWVQKSPSGDFGVKSFQRQMQINAQLSTLLLPPVKETQSFPYLQGLPALIKYLCNIEFINIPVPERVLHAREYLI